MARRQVLETFKQQRQLLPLLLLTTYCINVIIRAIDGTVVLAGDTYNFELTAKHYIAFGAIGLNFFIYSFLRPFYKYSLGLTITAGLFNLITFSALETRQIFGLGGLEVGFQPSAFLAGLLAYIVNFKRVNEFIIVHLMTARTPEEQNKIGKERMRESVDKFKEKYRNYSVEMLTEIVIEKKYVPEALEAARQLLKERHSNENTI